MSEICATCGLPKPLCVCETIAKESQSIKVYTVKKKFGKLNTRIEGLDAREIDVRDVSKRLKSELACGGTVKSGIIELQGNHPTKVKKILVSLGFSPETISIR